MIPVSFSRAFVASAVLLTTLCGVAGAQDAVLSDQILPKDTYLRLSIPSVTRLKEGMAKSSTGALWADPAFDDFKTELKNAFGSQLDEGLGKVQEALGLSVEELLNIPTGEACVAICAANAKNIGAVLLLDIGENSPKVEGLLEKAVAALSQHSELEQADFELDGTEVTLFNVKAPIAKQTTLAKEFGWFIKDTRMVVATNKAILEMVLNNWSGDGEQTLKSNNVFAYIMEKCQTKPDADIITLYFDPIGLFTKLVQSGSLGQAGAGAGMALGFLPTLGLSQMKAMGSVSQLDVDGFEGVSRSFIYSDQPPMGLMRVFTLDQVDQTPPKWVKEGASLFLTMKWKITDAYDAVEGLVDQFQGAGALAQIIEDAATKGPMVHIKNDVIDQLDGTLSMVQAPKPDSESEGTDHMLFTIGVRDSKRIQDLLAKLTSQPGFPGESREFQGATVYEIDPGNGQVIGFTVANNMLMIGIGDRLLEQALRNDDDVRPLAETEAYKRIAEHFRSGAVAITYTDPVGQYKSLWDLLKSGKAAENFPGMDEFFERIDFSKLPSFDAIEKYLAPAGGSWYGDENGVLMESFALKPGSAN